MGEDRTHDQGDRTPSERKLTIAEAASTLGLTSEAVRTRIRRNKLRSVKEESTVYVLLPSEVGQDQTRSYTNQTEPEHAQTHDQTELVVALRDQVSHLKEQLSEERRSSSELRRLL